MLEEYYNKETKTLTIPFNFNEELKDLPLDTEIIIFDEDFDKYEDSLFNCPISDILAPSLTHLTFGTRFNESVDKLPNSLTHLTFGRKF